jgi:hypothetical protein
MATQLPELDGARLTVLALHNGEEGQFLHLLASGVTPEYTWRYGTIASRMPVLGLRDRNGRWHTARPARSAPPRDTDDFMLWLRVRAAAGRPYPIDRPGRRGANSRAPCQAAAQLETQSFWSLKLLPDAAPDQRICMLLYALLTADRRPDLPNRGRGRYA